MERIETKITIAAPANVVWHVLTQFEAYPQWNPFIRSVSGRAKVGGRLTIRVQPEGGMPMSFKPTVLRAEVDRELRWVGKLLFGGIFDGEHSFVLTAIDGKHTHLHHNEEFRGLLVPLFRRWIHGSTASGFRAMNEALKQRAESEAR